MLRPSPNHGTQRLPNDDDDDQNRLISAAQYGFVKGRSTEVHLLHCTNLITGYKAIGNKHFVDIVYVDFAKAFIDTVYHAKLLYKHPKYGITGNILKVGLMVCELIIIMQPGSNNIIVYGKHITHARTQARTHTLWRCG